MAEVLVAGSYIATLGGVAAYAAWLYFRHRSLGS
jgi:hypothetical protein